MPKDSVPSAAEAVRRAMARQEAGDFAGAADLFRAALAAHPAHAELWCLLGIALKRGGTETAALDALEKAALLAPDRADIQAEFGIACGECGRHEDAVRILAAALAAGVDSPLLRAGLGDACRELGRRAEAVTHYEAALAGDPGNLAARTNLGAVLLELDRAEESVAVCRTALNLAPDDPSALVNLGAALQAAGRHAEAEVVLRRAVDLAPEDLAARLNLGTALQRLDRTEEAIACFRAVLDRDAAHAEAWSNLGNALQDRLALDDARAAHDRAVALDPDNAMLHWNRAMTLLLAGDYAEGFAEYEWRRRRPDRPPRSFPSPVWDGSDPAGRRILLHAEQGLGDAIQFARYAPLLARAGATVILACPDPLAALFTTLDGDPEIVAERAPPPPHDCHASLLSLPHLMNTTLAAVPAETPYLAVPEGTTCPLAPHGGRPRIGLVWAGNPRHANDRNRSIPVAALRPLFAAGNVEWIGLQVGPRAGEAEAAGLPVREIGSHLDNFADTAAAIAALDLVIAVDTATAHLAGALACPVWLVLPFAPDWRWLTGRENSPWYPTMRLFRQTAPGDWAGVVARLQQALAAWMEARMEEKC